MDDLARSVAAAAGLAPETARKAIGIVLDVIQKSASPATTSAILDRLAGARKAAAAAAEDEAEGGGTAVPGLAGLADRLTAEGLPPGDIETFARAVLAGLRREVGQGAIDGLVGELPELAPFI